MLVITLFLLPLLGGIVALLIKGQTASRSFALLLSLAFLALGVTAAALAPSSSPLLIFTMPWIPSVGAQVTLSIGHVSGLFILLTAVVAPIVMLAASKREWENPHVFYSLILFMLAGLVGVFTAQDGLLFYVFWELALIPVYFLAAGWGSENRRRATLVFFIYTVVGSLAMLAGLIYLYFQTPDRSFSLTALRAAGQASDASTQSGLFWLFFLAFAIKMPIFPFHTWQPDTYVEAPAPATILLSGIMLKMGIFGTMVWLLPSFPRAAAEWQGLILLLSVGGILWGAAMALVQDDLKRLLAYSSFSHVGMIAAGLFTLSPAGWQGALSQSFAHAVNVAALFFLADAIERRTGTRRLSQLGGLALRAPYLAATFLVVLLGSVALPLTNGFVGEFLLLKSVYQIGWGWALGAGISVILGAAYMLKAYRAIFFGEISSAASTSVDLTLSEKIGLSLVCVAVVVFGVLPGSILHLTEPGVGDLLKAFTSLR